MPNEKKFTPSLLNYFSTYTETRFNFNRQLSQKWSNDHLTLDLAFFPDFCTSLLEKIDSGQRINVVVREGDFKVVLDKNIFLSRIFNDLSGKYDFKYLDACIDSELARAQESSPVVVGNSTDSDGAELSKKDTSQAKEAGISKYHRALKKRVEDLLIALQDDLIKELQQRYRINTRPETIFGLPDYLNNLFNGIESRNVEFTDSKAYIDDLRNHLERYIEDITLYDLYYNLSKYIGHIRERNLYLYFHSIGHQDSEEASTSAHPLYFAEVQLKASDKEVTVSSTKDLIFINTPAINSYKFDTVLTTPRASTYSFSKHKLLEVEGFIQSKYGFQDPFILNNAFSVHQSSNEDWPVVSSRIGFQANTTNVDTVFDYSDLISKVESGESSKLSNLVDNYINGTVPSYTAEVNRTYSTEFGITSPKSYITDGPIPVNPAQRRVLLALQKPENKTIVVDGPPGTGKSYTIAALTYWANQNNKSIVVTSHKTEALNVIDRNLTEKFKDLHPQAKPSIIRLDSHANTNSDNTLSNTLSSNAVNRAIDRTLNFNFEAVRSDESTIEHALIEGLTSSLGDAEKQRQFVESVSQYEPLNTKLDTKYDLSHSVAREWRDIAFDQIEGLLNSGEYKQSNFGINLEQLKFAIESPKELNNIISACERLNRTDEQGLNYKPKIEFIPDEFIELLADLQRHFKQTTKVYDISRKDASAGLIQRVFGKIPSEEELNELISKITGLQFKSIITEISTLLNIPDNQLTIEQVVDGSSRLKRQIDIQTDKNLLRGWVGDSAFIDAEAIQTTYNTVKPLTQDSQIPHEIYTNVAELFTQYGTVLEQIGVTSKKLSSLWLLSENHPEHQELWRWIKLRHIVYRPSTDKPIDRKLLHDYYKIKQKQLEYHNDKRLETLNQHPALMSQINVSYNSKKRFTVEQTKLLLEGVSCIIADPASITQYFPMEEDIIDVLIIDEASQVSIANSLSLILRAKQVVIFGDEYQYGAVSAQNVNANYAKSYFSTIVNAYKDDFQTSASEQEEKELLEWAVQDEGDEAMASLPIKPEPGQIEWLKTFNIRTSTLAFAKAIANYSTSLSDHLRSYPEIISYSNEFFYKPAQMELVINRIRTKPIEQVLRFIPVEVLGRAGDNENLDEIAAIIKDIKALRESGFTGTIGIITSHREQKTRMEEKLRDNFNMNQMHNDHKLETWFVGDVQGEERDIIYYSLVECKDKNIGNLAAIYPIIGGTADNIQNLKMQRLNVGFSRAKDSMVFVHSQPLEKFNNTRLGDALLHYRDVLNKAKENDIYIDNIDQLESPMEKHLYGLLIQTSFVKENQKDVRIIPQFNIGEYIKQEFRAYIPNYRCDFLVTWNDNGQLKELILEYDGFEFHFNQGVQVNASNYSQEYTEYDKHRKLQLMSYGYRVLNINKFNLKPNQAGQNEVDVLNTLIRQEFA